LMGIGGATGFAGITRGGSLVMAGLVVGNGGGAVTGGFVAFNPPGGTGSTAGGVALVPGFTTGTEGGEPVVTGGVPIVAGMLGPVGFFDPKIRARRPGFLPESATGSAVLGAALAVVAAGVIGLSLSKTRPRTGRFSDSLSPAFDESGSVAPTDGSSGSFVRCFALGCSVGFGGSTDFGAVPAGSTLSTMVIVSPLLVSLRSVRYVPSGCLSLLMTLNGRSPLPSKLSMRTAPTLGGPSPSPRPTAAPTVTAVPASAAHTHRLLNHRVMTICLRVGCSKRHPWRAGASVRDFGIGLPGFAGSPAFTERNEGRAEDG